MKRLLLLVLIISSCLSCKKADLGPSTDCEQKEEYSIHPKAERLNQLLEKYKNKGLPGISLLIRDSSGVWAGAVGKADITENIDFKPCHISKTASITKSFVGVVALKFVEEGLINLDDLASKWLSEDIVRKVKNLDKVTIRQLLNHTTGIYDLITDTEFYLNVLNEPDKNWTQKELLKFVYNKKPYFGAGEKTKYSNTNTLLVSLIIESASGKEHSILVNELIINPLGLNDTYYYWHDKLPNDIAHGYYDLYNNQQIQDVTNYNTGSGNGYGGLYSTVYDMQIFIEALFKDKTLLTHNSLEEMMKFQFLEDVEGANDQINGRELGLGIMKDFMNRDNPNEYAYGHRGRDLGYTGDLYYFPNQDVTLSLLINYGTDGNTSLRPIFFDFRKDLVDLLMD